MNIPCSVLFKHIFLDVLALSFDPLDLIVNFDVLFFYVRRAMQELVISVTCTV